MYGKKFTIEEFDALFNEEKKYFESVFNSFYDTVGEVNNIGANYYYDFDDVSFLSINTALLSVGGNAHLGDDDRNLVYTTEGLDEWVRKRKDKTVCLVLHHPISWLSQSWRDHLETLIKGGVNYVFHGHEHKKDLLFRLNESENIHIFSAPALFSDDADRLGYYYLDQASLSATYRQWSPANSKFVVGADFSGNDSGVLALSAKEVTEEKFIRRLYTRNLNSALQLFSDIGADWVDRRISRTPEKHSFSHQEEIRFESTEDILKEPKDICVMAPAEYGLTSFGHYLCLKGLDFSKFGYVLCLKQQRIFSKEMKLKVVEELEVLGKRIENLDFIVVDSWCDEVVKDKKKAIEQIKKAFPDLKIIVLKTCAVAAAGMISGMDSELTDSGINEIYYLYALTRGAVRSGVKEYSKRRHIKIGNEDQIVSKVIHDFDFLNLPRTPLNCFTLLRILESNFHDSIINRGDMVSRILSFIFSEIEVPSYSSVPDVKDCEYIMGYFCADIIKNKNDCFARDYFIEFCQGVCAKKYFNIDASVMFDILFKNRIIVKCDSGYCFRFFYWVNYFSAMNMVHDSHFRGFMLSSGGYISHPEIIEFYTGSDRKRDDALVSIKKDLDEAIRHLNEKVGEEGLFPYVEMRWVMSEEQQEQLAKRLDEQVSASSLPTQVKDEYSDRTYDPAKPYHQTVNQVLNLTSMKSLMHLVSCAGKALRNSDFADSDIRLALMSSFVDGMVQINRVLVLLSTLLAKSGRASFEDAGFRLVGNDWCEGALERQYQIIRGAPGNLIDWYALDLFSEKMGPLVSAAIQAEPNGIFSMYLVCMAVRNRPAGWNEFIQRYIEKESKESYGLWAVFQTLCVECKYGFHDGPTDKKLVFLAKMCVAKHNGAKKLGKDKINKMDGGFLRRTK